MTIVNSSAADGFIQRLPKDLRFYLVHGADEGLTHERSKAIVGKVLDGDMDPLRIVRLEGDAIARDPGVLADEAYAIPMFGGSRVIWIDAQGRDLMPALEPLFAEAAGRLHDRGQGRAIEERRAASQRLRKSAERGIGRMLPGRVESASPADRCGGRRGGPAIAPDARAALVDLLGADRQTTRGEIAKLVLYARGRPRIEIEDVEAIVSDAAPSALDELVDQALSGDLKRAAATATRYFSEGGDGDPLMIRLIQRLTLIHRLRLEMDQGQSFNAACQAVYVRLPPAAVRKLAVEAERWTSDSLARRLPVIRAASARVRSEPRLAEVLATRAIWSLASRSGGGRG